MAATGYTSGDPAKVDIAGDTMTGPLVLPGNPSTNLQAAPKQYVDAAGTSASTALAAHEADTTSIHGIANTALLETISGAAAQIATHAAAVDPHSDRAFTTAAISTHSGASDPHGDRAAAAAALAAHEADTTAVHGITNTASLETISGAAAQIATHAAASDPHADRAYTDTVAATKQPLDSDLTALAGLSPSNDDIPQRKAGAWTNRTPAQFKTDLALVKGDVGLANVDNVSDANKPISTATQTALDGKAATSHNHAAGDITSGTLAVARGGTGVGSVTSGSYVRGAGTSALVERTPAEVLSDIGAAASAHTHTVRQTVSFGDDRPTLTVGSGTMRWYNRTGVTLTILGAWASVGVVPTGADLIVDIHKNGTTIYTTQSARPTITASTNGGALTTPAVTSLADGDYLTADIDQIGSTIAGGQLSVGVVVTYAG